VRFLAVVVACLPLAGQPVSPAASGTVEGVVVNSVTGVGIGGATVRLTLKTERYETVTDGAGTFHIAGIKAGDYITTVEKSSFTVSTPLAFRRTPVHVRAEKEPVRLRFELMPPAILRGRVFGIDGKPAAKVWVDLGGGKMVPSAEDGSFEIDDAEPGSYTLVARPRQTGAGFVQDGVRMETLPTYFPSALDLSAAQEIRVQPGVDQGGYDIRLQAAPVYRVRGAVLDPAGKPAAKAVVEIFAKATPGTARGFFAIPSGPFSIATGAGTAGARPLIEPAVTKTDGSFEFPSIPAGDWTLRAESDTIHDAARQKDVMLYGAESVALGRGDIDDLAIQLRPSFDLGLSFELSDGSPAPDNLSFQVALIPQESASPDLGSRPQRGPGGPARIENVQPGQYRVEGRMLFDRPYYAARVLMGGADVTGQIVQLSPASPPVRVVLGPAATLRGTVKQGDGAAVMVWPQSTLPGDAGKSALCGAGGAFEMRGLPPGEYYAVAVDRYEPREMTTAAYLRGMISKSASVRLEEGATASLDLSLTR
jgi:hypothetical protein